MIRRPLLVALVASAAAALSFPAVSQARLQVLKDQENADPVVIATFTTAKCRKAKKKRASLRWIATARNNGYELHVNAWRNGLELAVKFGGESPADFTVSGPDGSWTSLNRPSQGIGVGALKFNSRKKTRFGLGFSPAFDSSFSSTISVGGGVKCKYPKKKKRRR